MNKEISAINVVTDYHSLKEERERRALCDRAFSKCGLVDEI